MTPNDMLLAHLAAESEDRYVVGVMQGSLLGIPGEIGESGFGATTLDGHLAVFSQPEFASVAGLPEGIDFVESTFAQALQYIRAVGLVGMVINPGTHQRFVALPVLEGLGEVVAPPLPAFGPWNGAAGPLLAAIEQSASAAGVEAVWAAWVDGPALIVRPHPNAAFEAGLLARDQRIRSFAGSPWWTPVYAGEASKTVQARFSTLETPLEATFAQALTEAGQAAGLTELWAFRVAIEDEAGIALAYEPHPSDAFAATFELLSSQFLPGERTVPLLSAEALRNALDQIGARLI